MSIHWNFNGLGPLEVDGHPGGPHTEGMLQNVSWKALRKEPAWLAGAVVIAIALVMGVSRGICAIRAKRALALAETQLQKGFGALAAETADRYREQLSRQEKGCQVLCAAYFDARRTDRLEWMAQACIENGVELPDVYVALAAARELTGRDNDAIAILNSAATKFEKSPDPFYRLAQIFRRLKRNDAAAAGFTEAMKRAPDNGQLALEAMDFLVSLDKWADAKQIADRIRGAKTDNATVKLLLARVYKRTGDPTSAEALANEARALLSAKPDQKEALERAFADVLGGSGSAAGGPAAPPGQGGAPPGAPREAPPISREMPPPMPPPAGQPPPPAAH